MKTLADTYRDARDYANNHFVHELGHKNVSEVYKARQASEEVNKTWTDMFDAYVARWED